MKKIGIILFFILLKSLPVAHADQFALSGVVIVEQVNVQDEKGVSIGTLFKGAKINYELVNDQLMKFSFQGKEAFIKANDIEYLGETNSSINEKNIGFINTNESYTLYQEPSINSMKVFVGLQEEKIQVRTITKRFFEVEIAGVVAYLPIEQGVAIFDKSTSFDVIGKNVPVYEMAKGRLVHKGTLAYNTSWKIERESGNFHVLRIGSKEVLIPLVNTFPSQKHPSVQIPKSAKYPLSLFTEKQTPVFTKDGRALGSVNKGTKVHIKGIDGRRAIINFLGKEARIYFNHLTHQNAIQPKQNFSYLKTVYYLQVFATMYPEFTEIRKIGKSLEGRDIYAFKLGKGKKEILMDASVHAREHMTTNVLLEKIDIYSYQYLNNLIYESFPARSILNNVSIWFIPMVNPDGVTLVQSGAKSVQNGLLATKINKGSTSFEAWKANVRGVDLNDNFDSGWEMISTSITRPNSWGYRGLKVFSEPESQALRNFVESRNFKGYYSYHSSGQIIYWFNFQKGEQATRDIKIAKQVAALTGYKLIPPLYLEGSGATTDWFIKKTKMPGLVIEISPYVGNRPVPLAHWDSIWKQNHKVGFFLAKEANSR